MSGLQQQYANIMAELPQPYSDGVLINTPKVAEGMIKVKWNGNNWVKVTDSTEEWYDYSTSSKEWANVVLSDATFNEDGTLNEEEAYSQLVWIPRYAYKITSLYHTASEEAGNIEVVFIGTDNKDQEGNTYSTIYPNAIVGGGMDDYVVHPAFEYGDKKLEGIWVGKFESSNISCTTDKATGEVAYEDLEEAENNVMTIKANVTSWRSVTTGEAFDICLAMNENIVYGLSSNDNVVDPHMMKNSEWGAVAYLTQSTYGKNSQVYINNSSTYITGNAGSTVDAGEAAGVTNAYNTDGGMEASTTGNIYGIYDMNGGNAERVAAYVNNGHTNLTTYGGNLTAEGTEDRYREVYSSTVSDGTGNETIQKADYELANPLVDIGKYGDAIYETSGNTGEDALYSWYNDFSDLCWSKWPFFQRGSTSSNSSKSGMFAFDSLAGSINKATGFRVVVPVI